MLRQLRGIINRVPLKVCAPKVSVIIPAYNVEEYIDETLWCVTNQSLLSFEAIIIDDGSADLTKVIAERHVKKDLRFKVLTQKNEGASEARNRGVKCAKGKYVYYLDADDLITLDTFEELYKSCESNNAEIALQIWHHSRKRFEESAPLWLQEMFQTPAHGVTVVERPDIFKYSIACGKLMNRKFLIDNDIMLIKGINYEDQPYTAELYCRAKRINIVIKTCYWWRIRFDYSSLSSESVDLGDIKERIYAALATLDVIRKYGNDELYLDRLLYYICIDFAGNIVDSGSASLEYYNEIKNIYLKFLDLWHEKTDMELPLQAFLAGQLFKTESQEMLRKFSATMAFSDNCLVVDNVDGKPSINLEKTFFEPDMMISTGKPLYSVIDKTKTYHLQEVQAIPAVEIYASRRNGDEVIYEGYAYLTCIDPKKFNYKISVTASPLNAVDLQVPLKFEHVKSLEAIRIAPARMFDAGFAGFKITGDMQALKELGKEFYLNFTISAAGFAKQCKIKHGIIGFSEFEPEPNEKISDIKIAKIDLTEDTLLLYLERNSSVESDTDVQLSLRHDEFPVPEPVKTKFTIDKKEITVKLPLCASYSGYPKTPIAARTHYDILCDEIIDGIEHKITPNQKCIEKLPEWKYFESANIRIDITSASKKLVLVLYAPHTTTDIGAYNVVRNKNVYFKQNTPSNPKDVLFVSEGKEVNDTPLAIHNELVSRAALDEYTYNWVLDDYSKVLPEGGKRVLFDSKEYFDALTSSGTYFSTSIQPTFFQKRQGQRIVSIMLGYPFKDMGIEFHRSSFRDARDIDLFIKRFKQWDYFVSPAPYASELYKELYEFEGEMLEVGYPKNDIFFHVDRVKEVRARIRKAYGIADDKKVILYAPTFRDYLKLSPASSVAYYVLDVEKFAADLGENYVILKRGHPNFEAQINTEQEDRNAAEIIDVSVHPNINDLIIASDLLIGDYSSIRFDYSLTRKPIINYAPDLEKYCEKRKLLMPYEDSVLGPIIKDYDDLLHTTLTANKWSSTLDYKAEQNAFYHKYTPLEDGYAAERVVDALFPELR
ncbi:MAG: bifunctional glycosyltransferase family 2 protein/CDP-glycerol:glycerophosphate glycerophosphotransferase [Bifidobacteriaceae bacterium]|nr:bifunctional glycosyltransferase family 2 protein/CDP-glycerol:glycerophosphate glycerophosphotransferase [Bifidobacteriaceae bacterium]